MVAHDFGVDFNKLRGVMMDSYGRLATLPSAGFAAGPCLLKDTMQLAASYNNNFLLGNAAMMINEGLPNFIINDLKIHYDLTHTNVGIPERVRAYEGKRPLSAGPDEAAFRIHVTQRVVSVWGLQLLNRLWSTSETPVEEFFLSAHIGTLPVVFCREEAG